MVLVDRISKHNCSCGSAVPDDLHYVQNHDRAPRTIEALSHWPAAKREQLLESEETIVLVLLSKIRGAVGCAKGKSKLQADRVEKQHILHWAKGPRGFTDLEWKRWKRHRFWKIEVLN